MTHQAIFITGTDTGIGKTTITAALLLALQQLNQSVGVLKPLETGIDGKNPQHSDTERLRGLLSPPPAFNEVCLYAFSQPLAPLAAARKTGSTIDLLRIRSYIDELTKRHAFLLVEGAGGIFTPLTPQRTLCDLVTMLNVPCLIVGSTNLGGVNHCLLTVRALQQAKIRIWGIVLNQSNSQHPTAITRQQQESTVELIREGASAPVFGPIDFTEKIKTSWQEGVTRVSENPKIQQLAQHLIETAREIE